MDKYEAVKHLIEQGKDATLEDGVVMLRSRATGAALDREYKAMKKDLKIAGYNGSLKAELYIPRMAVNLPTLTAALLSGAYR